MTRLPRPPSLGFTPAAATPSASPFPTPAVTFEGFEPVVIAATAIASIPSARIRLRVALFCLHLHRSAEVPGRTGRDHQIAALQFVLTTHELPDRSDRVDDRRAGWISHEAL